MRNKIAAQLLVLAQLLAPAAVPAQQKRETPAPKEELAEITARGRELAAYDVAAWHATDAVRALSPPEGSVARYIARREGAGWVVAFGRFGERRDKFLIAYEATQGASVREFKAARHEPPKEDAGFYFRAALAIDAALAAFKGAARPHNVAVLPAQSGLYVYVLPAQTEQGVYPHGGDARYLVSPDGARIVEARQMHRSVIEFRIDGRATAGYHTAVVDNVPEDTDVFYVLSRKPAMPEYIATEKFIYLVQPDGAINYLMTREAFNKAK